MDEEKVMTRREFARTAARVAVAAGFALLAWRLAGGRRQDDAAPTGQRCLGGGVCRGCPSLPGCGLPTALSMKRATGGTSGEGDSP
jgi:hypothetical protein